MPPLVVGASPIPGFLTQVVMRTLEKDPALRPTAREQLTDLVRVARYSIDGGAPSGELALPRTAQLHPGNLGFDSEADKTGEVVAVSLESTNPSAKTLPPATAGSAHNRTIEEEPPKPLSHEHTQEFVRTGKSGG